MSAHHILACAAVSAGLACTSAAAPGVTGTVTDPAGDATPSAAQVPSPDLIRATVDIEDANATFTVVFAPGTLRTATTFVALVIDIDDDYNTGAHHLKNDLIGIDYSLEFGAGTQGGVQLFRYNGSTYDRIILNTTLIVGTNSFSVTLPLSLFGDDDGQMAFKGGASALNTDGTYTAALDWLPNPGLDPGRVR